MSRRKVKKDLLIHMDNSRCHNNLKVTSYLKSKSIERMEHPPYSPDLSPYDFWLFGYLKEWLKEKEIEDETQLVKEITDAWDAVTFDQLQSVFHDWILRLDDVIKKHGSYYNK